MPIKAAITGFGRIGGPLQGQRLHCGAPATHSAAAVRCRPHNSQVSPAAPLPLTLLPPLAAGRLAMRIAFDCPDLEVVHINEPSPIESSAYLLKFDSVHGAPAQSGLDHCK